MLSHYYDEWIRRMPYDSTVLVYLTHRCQYLQSRDPASQEHRNLRAQMEAILDLPYDGGYKKAITTDLPRPKLTEYAEALLDSSASESSVLAELSHMTLKPTEIIRALRYFAQLRADGVTIEGCELQSVSKPYWSDPVWILWCYMFDRELTERERYILVCYRHIFAYYFFRSHYQRAALIFIAAMNPLERSEELPLQSPYILRAVLRCNLEPDDVEGPEDLEDSEPGLSVHPLHNDVFQ